MVGKGVILFRVEHFQQSGSGVAAVIEPEFINFIQHNERIDRADPFHRLDDSAGHSADVCAPVSANFRFVAHAAETQSGKFAVQCFGDGFSERGFPRAGRSHKTQNGAAQFLFVFHTGAHRHIFQNSLFDAVQSVMVFVQHRFGMVDVEIVCGGFRPRQFQYPVEIGTDDAHFGRHRRDVVQARQFFFRFLTGFFRQIFRFDLAAQFGNFSGDAVTFAEFVLHHADLFAQEKIALAFVHFLLHLCLNAVFQFQYIQFPRQNGGDALQSVVRVGDFQNFLPNGDIHFQHRCD